MFFIILINIFLIISHTNHATNSKNINLKYRNVLYLLFNFTKGKFSKIEKTVLMIGKSTLQDTDKKNTQLSNTDPYNWIICKNVKIINTYQ